MRFALVIAMVIATLVAGTLTVPTVESAVDSFGVVDLDSVALPDFEVTTQELPAKHFTFTQGKLEGIKNAVRPLPNCYGGDECEVSVSGLRFTYKAVDSQADQKEFNVVVKVLHGLLLLVRRKDDDGKYRVQDAHVNALHQYVKEPVEFSSDKEENAELEEKLKKKSLEFLEDVARLDEFLHLFDRA